MTLALDGGAPVRTAPLPERGTLSRADVDAVMRLLEESLAAGAMPGYAGPVEDALCREFCRHMGGGHADGVSSGSMGAMAALAGLGLEPFGEVVVPPMTDAGPCMACVFLGLVPVPADGETRSFNMTAEGIAARLTPRTRAIMVAHIPGEPADMDAIMRLADAEGIPVVEDCSQAHGATFGGRPVGSFGAAAFFSTMFTKHLTTGGQGGILYTTRADVFERARLFANRGKPLGGAAQAAEDRLFAGVNASLTEIAATIGLSQLAALPALVARRRELLARLERGVADLRAVAVGWRHPQAQPSPWFLRLRLEPGLLRTDKEGFCRALTAEGYRASPHLRIMPSLQSWYRERNTLGGSGFPWTDPQYAGPRVPDYPIPNTIEAEGLHFRVGFHERWTDEDLDGLIEALRKVEAGLLR